jgi:hypothetical protein
MHACCKAVGGERGWWLVIRKCSSHGRDKEEGKGWKWFLKSYAGKICVRAGSDTATCCMQVQFQTTLMQSVICAQVPTRTHSINAKVNKTDVQRCSNTLSAQNNASSNSLSSRWLTGLACTHGWGRSNKPTTIFYKDTVKVRNNSMMVNKIL